MLPLHKLHSSCSGACVDAGCAFAADCILLLLLLLLLLLRRHQGCTLHWPCSASQDLWHSPAGMQAHATRSTFLSI